MATKKQDSKIKITLVRSLIGAKDNHIATAKSLGLKKIGDVTVQPANAQTAGKIKLISYLIKTEDAE
ncbi:MAG: 50S ribosomal protein L30 [Clostridia bacterium]|nr:50S ribosomal protein L30 [Clostridia bacterium]